MQPTMGRTLRRPQLVNSLWREISKDENYWVIQPKLNGDRACLGIANGEVHIQNRHGSWYMPRVRNAREFLKLSNGTCLDGEVWKGDFYPFEALAVDGKSFLPAAASEREVLAFQLVRFLGQSWMFERPTKKWLMRRWENLPQFEGVVEKRHDSHYVLAGSDKDPSRYWFKRLWDHRKTAA